MKHTPRPFKDRRGERGGAAVIVIAVAAVCLFMLLVIFAWVVTSLGGHSGSAGSDDDPAAESGTAADPGDPGDEGTVAPVEGCIIFANHPRVTPRFVAKVVQIAAQLRTDPNFLMATMKIESDFNPAIRNQMGGSATGLIQIVDSTAHRLGLPNAAVLASMSAEQQLEYVRRYYVMSGGANGRMREVEDAYMVVFYPKAAGRSPDYVIATKRMACTPATRRFDAYCGNEPYDLNRDGVILKKEAGYKVRRVYNQAMSRCRR